MKNKFNNKSIEKKIEKALDDSEIRDFLDPVKIVKYSELKNYNNIEDLLPNNGDYVIMLVESAPNNGHWVALLRYDDTVEYFDSYGLAPSKNLEWSKTMNKFLGQDKEYLNMLLDKTPLDVVYNPIEYQKDKSNINTCGRHCIFRTIMMKGEGLNLEEYYKFMNKMIKNNKTDYDKLVSYIIENTTK
jgi:hypothetical protein